ncbi:MAG: hypothetical protein EAZ85_08665 [Bacteroidetes bacterium]|nr:MAG: hypothetical protein EAZ85_08665 [Bacteroidota bacterium]TAG87462.1 MAG: hypothetical protein EAZ20_10570 [Bacteroidota bacterium]
MKRFIFLFFIFVAVFSCQSSMLEKTELSFYFWKTKLNLSEKEKLILKKMNIKQIYIRFFDVDIDSESQKPIPLSPIQNIENIKDDTIKIIPVVFITNRTMKNISHEKISDLAQKIFIKINDIAQKITFQEIQLDCDWNSKTKYNFFDLIKELQKITSQKNIKITSTLRLHQIKFAQKEGIPPVKNTTLMLYNMGNIQNEKTKNSIFELQTINAYLDNFDTYPLDIDYALPIFSWGVVKRFGKVVALLNEWEVSDKNRLFFEKITENQYKVIKSHYEKETYLYKDDEIRYETITKENLTQALQLLKNKRKKTPKNIVFYHLDTHLIDKFGTDFFEKLVKPSL